jgi:hypothetical protein
MFPPKRALRGQRAFDCVPLRGAPQFTSHCVDCGDNNLGCGAALRGTEVMRITTILCGGILTGIAANALACELPKLVAIPPKDQVAGKEAELRAAAATYFTGIQAYTACVQAELAGAGGDSAPLVVRQVLVARNNAAVAEAQFMMKLFTDNVGAVEGVATDPAPAAR